MSQPARPARRFVVSFEDVAWAEDMSRATAAGRHAATTARNEYEARGVSFDELKPCEAEGPGGTALRRCVKIYVPAPAGRYGLVLQIARRADGKLGFAYLAFGLRHPGRDVRQPSVYEVAHRRLNPS